MNNNMNTAKKCNIIIIASAIEVKRVCNSDFSQVERDLFVSITAEMYMKLARAYGFSLGLYKALQKANHDIPADLHDLDCGRAVHLHFLADEFCFILANRAYAA